MVTDPLFLNCRFRFLSIGGEKSIATHFMVGILVFNSLINLPSPVPKSRTFLVVFGIKSSSTFSPSVLCGILSALLRYPCTRSEVNQRLGSLIIEFNLSIYVYFGELGTYKVDIVIRFAENGNGTFTATYTGVFTYYC